MRAGDTGNQSPSHLFEELLRTGQIPMPNLVICPGDLSHQVDQAGQGFSWEFLKRAAQLSCDKLLISTTGNHDVDSRYQTGDIDAKGLLLDLKPSYPIVRSVGTKCPEDEQCELEYWARNFCFVSSGACRFVVLNSCAYHGVGKSDAPEYEHGRISARTLAHLKIALETDDSRLDGLELPRPALNVLVCHHHLEKDGSLEDQDQSQMVGAHALLQTLSSSDHGRWLVIHGHRHRARLFQPGGTTGPWVLSAASFSATRDRDYENRSPNQAHLIEIDFAGMERLDLRPAGTIQSWTWTPPMGWLSERFEPGGLPPLTGFGFRGSIDALAHNISDFIGTLPRRTWPDVCQSLPMASYVSHDQLTELRKVLKATYKVNVAANEDGFPYECGRSS